MNPRLQRFAEHMEQRAAVRDLPRATSTGRAFGRLLSNVESLHYNLSLLSDPESNTAGVLAFNAAVDLAVTAMELALAPDIALRLAIGRHDPT